MEEILFLTPQQKQIRKNQKREVTYIPIDIMGVNRYPLKIDG